MQAPEDPGPLRSDVVPPVAARRPTVLEAHGDRRVDDWFWLRDAKDPSVLSHLVAENAYTEATTAGWNARRDELFEEIRSRIVETDLSVPVRKDGWWYYERTTEGSAYPSHCRLPVSRSGAEGSGPPLGAGPWPEEEVLLDENSLAEGHAYLQVGSLAVSPGHSLLAYATDTAGHELFTLKIRDLATGKDLPEQIEGTYYGIAWAADERTLFYTRPDAANRPFQLWRHRVRTQPEADVLVHQEDDERFHLGVDRTKDGEYVVLDLQSKVTTEVRTLPSARPDETPTVVRPRAQGVEYAVEHHHGTFLVLSNEGAENFRLVAVPTSDPTSGEREVIPHRPEIRLDGIDVFAEHLVAYERVDGMSRIRVHRLEPGDPWASPLLEGELVPVPETPSTSWGGPNPEFHSTSLRYEYTSLVTPRSVYELDLRSGEPELLKRQPVLGGYDPDDYATESVWAVSDDGTKVPMSVVRRTSTKLDGSAPCLLYGYGAYETSIDPTFSSVRLCLLDRGFVFAIAHVRGGGEMGRRWYEDGKLLEKRNTFTDFVACARALIAGSWTSRDRLVARGGSAGGLLIGAVLNSAPELFRAAVAEVPFVDCLTTMSDPSLPLTVIEWEEWGDPVSDPSVYEVMRAYSPYDNVGGKRYPDLLVTAGLEDPRVGFWEPVKWVQRLRQASADNRVIMKIELEAGHAGPSGRYAAWKDEAFVLCFVLDAVGM